MEIKVQQFLKQLPSKTDDIASTTTVFGRALSRSDSFVHLATSKGVFAVPIESIQSVRAPFSDDPSRVELTLRGGDALRRLKRGLRPRSRPDDQPIVIIGPGVGTTVCTTTYTGEGDGETCDDEECTTSADDLD